MLGHGIMRVSAATGVGPGGNNKVQRDVDRRLSFMYKEKGRNV